MKKLCDDFRKEIEIEGKCSKGISNGGTALGYDYIDYKKSTCSDDFSM